LILAAVVLTVVMSLDYHWLRERAMFFYGCTLLVLALTLFAGAALADGSRLSFDLGPFRVQPAEFAKVTVLLALAAYLSEERGDQVSYPRFLGGLLLVGAPVGLILLQPDLGSASVLVVCAMGVLLVAGAKPKYILLITSLGLASAGAAVFSGVVEDRQLDRIEAFVRQNSDDPRFKNIVEQLRYAKRAIATGGVWGKGWHHGTQSRLEFLPEHTTDFIFSVYAEEWGLVGVLLLLALYVFIIGRCLWIAAEAKDTYARLLAGAIGMSLFVYVVVNGGMITGVLPVVGVPLPLMSYGGTSAVSMLTGFGVLMSIHAHRKALGA
jgi:rod shape determining protein RodA